MTSTPQTSISCSPNGCIPSISQNVGCPSPLCPAFAAEPPLQEMPSTRKPKLTPRNENTNHRLHGFFGEEYFTICNFAEVANGTSFNLCNPCNLWLIYPTARIQIWSSGSTYTQIRIDSYPTMPSPTNMETRHHPSPLFSKITDLAEITISWVRAVYWSVSQTAAMSFHSVF